MIFQITHRYKTRAGESISKPLFEDRQKAMDVLRSIADNDKEAFEAGHLLESSVCLETLLPTGEGGELLIDYREDFIGQIIHKDDIFFVNGERTHIYRTFN